MSKRQIKKLIGVGVLLVLMLGCSGNLDPSIYESEIARAMVESCNILCFSITAAAVIIGLMR